MQVQADSPQYPAEPRRRTPRILVVDDDPGIRSLCAAVLAGEGYEVIEAADGREGLERAASADPDLVLLDVRMPILDGYGLAAALRDDERTRSLPVVFVTAEPEPDVEGHIYHVGALGYLAKPFDPAALAALVRRLLEQIDSRGPLSV